MCLFSNNHNGKKDLHLSLNRKVSAARIYLATQTEMGLFLCGFVCLCLQPNSVATQVLQSVDSERDEVSSISQKCRSAVPRRSF